jgi:hypothetical protein
MALLGERESTVLRFAPLAFEMSVFWATVPILALL